MSGQIRVRWAGIGDDVEGSVMSVERTDPEGHELAEPMIWVLWDDAASGDLDLLTWDDVVEL